MDEDERYSHLYEHRDYPPGDVYAVLHAFGFDHKQRVLDLGCGRAALSKVFPSYTGVDVSSYAVMKNRTDRPGTYHHSSLDNLECVSNCSFDLVICSDVLEHIPPERIAAVIESIASVQATVFYFNICCRKSHWKDRHGNGLHASIMSHDEWCSVLLNGFEIHETLVKGSNLLLRAARRAEESSIA